MGEMYPPTAADYAAHAARGAEASASMAPEQARDLAAALLAAANAAEAGG